MWQVNDWWTDKFQTILKIGLEGESKEIQSRWSFIVFLSWEWRTLAKFLFIHRHIAIQLNLGFFEFCISFGSCRPNNFWIMHVTRKKDWKDETNGMVFCYQNCSDLLWEKIVLVIEAEGWEFSKYLKSLEQFIQTVIGQNNFWYVRMLFQLVPGGFSYLIPVPG